MTDKNPSATAPAGERIAKVLARAGVASRREAERMIAAGRISVDGRVLDSPALNVLPSQDIRVDGTPIPDAQPMALFRYHKPTGVLVTRTDPEGRTTVFDALPEEHKKLIAVGRLDLNSEGLLLLTNDGEISRALELPSTGWTRRYRARAFGRPKPADFDKLANGIVVDGEHFGAIHAELERQQGGNAWITVSLTEGKNREVRRALEAIGLKVNRLIRTAYGPFQLGALKPGEIAPVAAKQVREQLGGLLANQTTNDAKPQKRAKSRSPSRPRASTSAQNNSNRAGTRPEKQTRNRPPKRRD